MNPYRLSAVCAALAVTLLSTNAQARHIDRSQIVTCDRFGCSDRPVWKESQGGYGSAVTERRAHKGVYKVRGTLSISVTKRRQGASNRGTDRDGYYATIDSKPDPRPGYWCAWWLRRHLNIARSQFPKYQYNLARAFATLGTAAAKGCVGCIAVFRRGSGGHVGLVESWDANGNPVILSGNFNGRVATYAHPASRLIALRWVS